MNTEQTSKNIFAYNRDLCTKFHIYYTIFCNDIIIDYIKFQVLKQKFWRYKTVLQKLRSNLPQN